jgi:hypothetical protein
VAFCSEDGHHAAKIKGELKRVEDRPMTKVGHYRLQKPDSLEGFWVLAGSKNEARQLIALNVDSDAINPDLYQCILDATFQPPFGEIVAYGPGGSRTITVTKRETSHGT